MNWRLRKFLFNGAHLVLALFVALTLFNYFPGGRALGCVTIGGASAALLLLQFGRLLKGFYDRMCRLEVYIPAISGTVLGVLGMLLSPTNEMRLVCAVELLTWAGIVAVYVNYGKRNFIWIGDGAMPRDSWINVPAEHIRAGDLILTSGRISRMTKNTVGHVELVVEKDGKLYTVTAYIECGIVCPMKTMRAVCKVSAKGHYVVLRPKTPFTAEQSRLAIEFLETAAKENREKVERDKPRIERNINRLLPDSLCERPLLRRFLPAVKKWLLASLMPTGYDSISMHIGTHRDGLWTCHWIVLKALEYAGAPVEAHESGLLGLGTGFLNPPYPASLMMDCHFEMLRAPEVKAAA